MARNTTESPVEKYLKEQVEAVGGRAEKLVLTSGKGFPDRTLLMPNGKIAFVECKRPELSKGKISPMQERWIGVLKSLGFTVRVVRNKDEIDELIGELR